MRKIILNSFLITVLFTLLVSCKVPSKDIQSLNFLEWAESFLKKLNNFDLNNIDLKAKKKFLDEEIFSKKQLLVFNKENTINFHTKEELISDFINTLDNNSIILKKPIYITKKFNKVYLSFDNKEWFYVKHSNRKKIFNINYKIETLLDEKKENLDVFLSASIDIKDEFLTKKDLAVEKPIIKLDPTLFSFKKGEKPNFPDLYKNIVYIPENTLLSGQLNISGNIIEAKKESNSIKLTALRDIFFYNNKKIFNISFNRDNWDFSIFKVKIDKDFDINSVGNEVNYILNITLNYKDS